MKCVICESDEVIYSGVDSIIYGHGITEKFCYRCSKAFYEINQYIDRLKV